MARLGSGKGSTPTKPKKAHTVRAKNGMSGVSHDEEGPVYEEDLTEDQRAIRSAGANAKRDEIDQLDADFIAVRQAYRAKRKPMVAEERELRDSARLGKVRVPAQQTLPGAAGAK